MIGLSAAVVPLALMAACGGTGKATSSAGTGEAATGSGGPAALTVAVSILPQAYFVERVGGGHVDVQVMVPPGASPATYEPKPDQLKALSRASAYASIGVPFEATWLPKFQAVNTDMTVVDTTKGITRMQSDGNVDPHIWLSPRLVETQARTIHDALVQLDSAHAADYDAGLASFQKDIAALDSSISTTLSTAADKTFIVFHPAWSYFARDYDLEMIPIEVGGTEPSPAELANVIDTARERRIRVVFAQPEFSTAEAETIASSIGGEVLLISPLARDWLANMHKVSTVFAENLG
jgi:zinc transport system substrate-binding protein